MNKAIKFLPLLFFVLLILFFWKGLSHDPHKLPSAQIGKSLSHLKIQSLEDPTKTFVLSDYQGKMYLLNVWASWCASCADEHQFLQAIAKENITIIGLNYKDEPKAAVEWLKELGNPYQQVGVDPQGKLAIDLGVYGTPETFLVDAKGIIRFRYPGVLDEAVWEKEFLPRIKEASKS